MTKKELFEKLNDAQLSEWNSIKYYVNNCADIIKEIQNFMFNNLEHYTNFETSFELYNLIGKLRNNQEFLIYEAVKLKAHNQISN